MLYRHWISFLQKGRKWLTWLILICFSCLDGDYEEQSTENRPHLFGGEVHIAWSNIRLVPFLGIKEWGQPPSHIQLPTSSGSVVNSRGSWQKSSYLQKGEGCRCCMSTGSCSLKARLLSARNSRGHERPRTSKAAEHACPRHWEECWGRAGTKSSASTINFNRISDDLGLQEKSTNLIDAVLPKCFSFLLDFWLSGSHLATKFWKIAKFGPPVKQSYKW